MIRQHNMHDLRLARPRRDLPAFCVAGLSAFLLVHHLCGRVAGLTPLLGFVSLIVQAFYLYDNFHY
jgi:hypothetical protein